MEDQRLQAEKKRALDVEAADILMESKSSSSGRNAIVLSSDEEDNAQVTSNLVPLFLFHETTSLFSPQYNA